MSNNFDVSSFEAKYLGIAKEEDEEVKKEKRWMTENNWSEWQMAEIKETFSMFDKSGDGTIPLDTIGDAFRALGQAPTNAEIQNMMDTCQCNDDGSVSLDAFVKLLNSKGIQDDLELQDKLEEALKVFDNDQDGCVNAQVLRNVLTEYGEPLEDEDVEEMLQLAGVDERGKVNCFDLMRHISQK